MSHSNSIKKLLNIKEKNFKITKVCDKDIKGITTKVVYAVASKENTKCPCCNNKLIKNGFKIINIKILKASQYNTLLKISKQRYICKSCNKSFSHKLKLVNDNCSISNDVKLAIKLELKEAKSEKTIAKQFNVSPSTVFL